jgi:hypothetical protein
LGEFQRALAGFDKPSHHIARSPKLSFPRRRESMFPNKFAAHKEPPATFSPPFVVSLSSP